ncbi:MAG: PQQ-binding-like beta-propeller repeat protein [Planktomarina sp.]
MVAAPVSLDGRIFTLDSRSQVTAVSSAGAVLWSQDLTAIFDRTDDAAGGGLAVNGDQVFVTTGFGEIVALNTATGAENWRHDLSSFGGAAPTVFDGLVYVASRDGSAWAIHKDSGKIKWQIAGPESTSNLIGGPGPAITKKWAIFPFATGELMSTFRRGGLSNWTVVLSGQRTGAAAAAIDDITGGPIVVGSRIYVGNAAGRTAAMNLDDGSRIWTAEHGIQDAIAVAENALFVVDDENQLVRISASSGATHWSVPLPRYKTDRVKRRKGIYAHFGPILAGGQLWVASADKQLRAFSPETGALLRTIPLSDAATSRPIVVNNTLYVLTADARLSAFR